MDFSAWIQLPCRHLHQTLWLAHHECYHSLNHQVFDNRGVGLYILAKRMAFWVAYYNFLRPHKHNKYKVLNEVEMLQGADNMPGKWQLRPSPAFRLGRVRAEPENGTSLLQFELQKACRLK